MGPARFLNGLNITGDLTVTGNILPGASQLYNIGSTDVKWKNGYFQRLGVNIETGDINTTYVLDVRGKGYFESDILTDGSATVSDNLIVNGTSTLKQTTTIGVTTSTAATNLLTVNGKVVVNPSYNTANNSYNEGIRINQASNYWAEVAFGGAAGSTTGTGAGVWVVGSYGSNNNFYIANNGSNSSTNRFQATPTTGFRMYASASSGALQSGTLTLGSTPDAYNSSTSGGDVALEFWRGKNASWQIINTGGVLKFRNNYTNAAQSSYNVNTLDLSYNGNDSIIYTTFKPGDVTNGKSEYTLGLTTANWNAVNTKTLNFAYDDAKQYLTHAGVADVVNHSGKITLYRLIASGTDGTATSGNKLRPAVVLDAATGFISLEAPASNPTENAGSRIEFKYYNADNQTLEQPIYLSYTPNDSYRVPYGLKLWGSTKAAPYTWLEVEGGLYIGTELVDGVTDIAIRRKASSLYIGTTATTAATPTANKVAVSGYDNWLRLNDLVDFTNGIYTPSMIQTNIGLTLTDDDTANPSTYYFKTYNAGSSTSTEIFTDTTVITGLISIGSEGQLASSDFPVYISDKALFRKGIHVYGTSDMAGTAAGKAYSGGMYHAGHNSVVLHGDDYGVSGILFMSTKGTGDTNINSPSDRAFIQYHPYGVTTATAENAAPTLATSGEQGRFVIGIGNEAAQDYLVLQSPSVDGLKHQVGATTYTVATLNAITTTANYPIVTTTTNGLVVHNDKIVMNGKDITITESQASITLSGASSSISVNGNISADTFTGTYIAAQIIRW